MVDVAYSAPSNKRINRQVINQQINNNKQTTILINERYSFEDSTAEMSTKLIQTDNSKLSTDFFLDRLNS